MKSDYKKVRIFMGFQETAGYYHNLGKGFKEIGVESNFVQLITHPFVYGDIKAHPFQKIYQFARNKRCLTAKKEIIKKIIWIALEGIFKLLLLLWMLIMHDVFIFGYCSTLYGFRELPILKLFRKKIIYVFHGSDSRPAYLDANYRNLHINETIKETINIKRKVNLIERYADFVVAGPNSAHFHERNMVSYHAIGGAFDVEWVYREASETKQGKSVRILHCPSMPKVKGTDKIREAVANCKKKGFAIEYIEIIGKKNEEVIKEICLCDFVIDELYSDILMAVFATEAAYFGKPAIVGGYGKEEFERLVPKEQRAPVHHCHPERVEEAIEKLVVDVNYRKDLGARAKEFVEKNCNPRVVAEKYLRLITEGPQKEWLFNPKDIRYLHGFGQKEEEVKEMIRRVVKFGGKAALCIEDKPELLEALLNFASSKKVKRD